MAKDELRWWRNLSTHLFFLFFIYFRERKRKIYIVIIIIIIIITMPSAIIYFSAEEDNIIKEYSDKWNISKQDTVKRIVKQFEEDN